MKKNIIKNVSIPNLLGFIRALVIDNTDKQTIDNGRIKVFVPKLMPKLKPGLDVISTIEDIAIPINNSQVSTVEEGEIPDETEINEYNYIWARPTFAFSSYIEDDNGSGTYDVPRIGQWLFVIFEDGDPNKCYYTNMTPTIEGDIIPFTNTESAKDILTAKRRKNIYAKEWNDGTIFNVNTNSDNKSVTLKMNSGHVIRMWDRNSIDEQRIEVETAKGHLFTLNDKTGDIVLNNYNETFTMTIDDKGNINIDNSATTTINTKGDTIITTSGNTNIDTSAETNVTSGGNVNVKGATINLN